MSSYASKIKEKKTSWGSTILWTAFPAHGDVSLVVSIKGGERSAENQELADAHSRMLLEGTTLRTKEDIQILLDNIGASLSVTTSSDRLVFTGRVRSKHAGVLFKLIAEVLSKPTFPKKELVSLKKRRESELSLEEQNTRTQASISLVRELFSPEHPNWEETIPEARAALAGITQKTLLEYHASIVSKTALLVSAAGDIAHTELCTLVEKHFKSLPNKEVLFPEFAPQIPVLGTKLIVPIPDKVSIDYIAGIATGITSEHKDFPALMLGLQILGNRGGFTGRLMKTVREVEGLTYGVYAYPLGFKKAIDGAAVVWATFAPQLFAQGRAAILREIQKIITTGATDKEVLKHKTMYEARSRVLCANSSDIAHAAHDCAADGRALSFLDQFPKTILKLSKKEVNAALKKYIQLGMFSESAAGPITAFSDK